MKSISVTLDGRTFAVLLGAALTGVVYLGVAGGLFVKPAAVAAEKKVATKLAGLTAQTPKNGSDTPFFTTWKPAAAPILTAFAASVTPEKARPDYPRPQFVRADWKSLNGLWEFGFDDDNSGEKQGWSTGKPLEHKILVPFSFESALSGIGRGDEIHEQVWYRRTFDSPPAWSDRHLLLHFGAVDWETTVWVNGREVGRHRGGYTPFTLDITDALKSGGGPQELVVRAYDPSEKNPAGWQPRGKQRGSDGIWYTRTTGIWQSVWLEPVAEAHLPVMTLLPSLDAAGTGRCAVSGTLPTAAANMTVEATLLDGAKVVASQRATVAGDGTAALTLTLPKALPWTPETPHLYDVALRLVSGGKVIDAAASYTAFRSVGIAGGRLTLNGKPYFYRGVLDQGYWPDGIYTPPSDDAIRADVEAVKKLGFNMARKHIKVEDPRWYYWCDRLGVAVWQDMPSPLVLTDPEAREEYWREWTEEIQTTRSYPCIVHWIPFNENWGDPGAFQDEVVKMTKGLDPSRPLTDASGWTQRTLTDVVDSHDYGENLAEQGVEKPVKPKVVGECGGVGLTVPGHIWADGRVYVHTSSPDEMLSLIRVRVSGLYQAHNLSGFVYTQLTDVEHELNGLLTYDRKPKAKSEQIAAIMRGQNRAPALPGSSLRDWLVLGPIPATVSVPGGEPTPEALTQMAKILDTAYLPNESDLTPVPGRKATVKGGGDASFTWAKASGATLDFQKLFSGSEHSNSAAYAVAFIERSRTVRNATLYLGSDDGAVVWLNGKQIHRKVAIRGVRPREDTITGLTLRRGRNTLVVKVGQGTGGWGLSAYLQD